MAKKTTKAAHMEAGLEFQQPRPKARKRSSGAHLDGEMFGFIRDYGAFDAELVPGDLRVKRAPYWKMRVWDPKIIDEETGQTARWVNATGQTFAGCVTKLKRAIKRQQAKEYRERD